MKLRTKICPEGCRYPSIPQKRIRMLIHSRIEDNKKPINMTVTLLDWYCPICEYIYPVSDRDVLKISRTPKYSMNIELREQYFPKEKSE